MACTNAKDLQTGNITIYWLGTSGYLLEDIATILHEGIHAEIYRYVDQYKKGLDPNNRPNLLYWYMYYKAENGRDYGTTEAQHQHMADNYVKPIAKAIRAIDNNSYPLEYYMGFGWDGLRKYGYDDYMDNGVNIELSKDRSGEYYRLQKTVLDNSQVNCN